MAEAIGLFGGEELVCNTKLRCAESITGVVPSVLTTSWSSAKSRNSLAAVL